MRILLTGSSELSKMLMVLLRLPAVLLAQVQAL